MSTTLKILSKFLVLLIIVILLSCSRGPIIATVESSTITVKEFNKFCQKKALLLGVEKLSADERKDVLDSLIRREVVYLYAKRALIKAPDSEMKKAMKRFSFLDKILKRREIEKNVIFEQMERHLTGDIRATGEEVQGYYREHRDEFIEPARYKVYLVKADPIDVRHVIEKLRSNPGAFDDMALKRVSQELIDLNKNAPYNPKSDFPEEMWPYLERMKVGEIAGPVMVKKGTFIFKLVGKKPAYLKPLSEVYIEIEHLVTAQKREEAFETWYASIKGNYKIEIKEKSF